MSDNTICPFCKRKLFSESKFPYINFQCSDAVCNRNFSNIENHYFRFHASDTSEVVVDIDFPNNITVISDEKGIIYSLNDVFDPHNEEQFIHLMKFVNKVIANMVLT